MAFKKAKRKKPQFHRSQSHNFARIAKKGWRRPRGKDSRQRRREKCKGARPGPGYRQPRLIRNLHPSGFMDMLVYRPLDIETLDPKKHGLRIAACVGERKRVEIIKSAEAKGFHVFNK